MAQTVRITLPQLALFELEPLPAALPVAPRKPGGRLRRACAECGVALPSRSWQPGDLCGECRGPRRQASADARTRMCGGRNCCPDGECQAIPY